MPKESKQGRQRYVNLPHSYWSKLDPDIKALGSGSRNMGGVQGVMMAAATMYLALEPKDRRELASFCSVRNLEVAQKITESHWIIRVLVAAGELGEEAADILESQFEE